MNPAGISRASFLPANGATSPFQRAPSTKPNLWSLPPSARPMSMRGNCVSIPLLALLAMGCAGQRLSPPSDPALAAQSFPTDAMVTQRGILTVHGRQFPLNGYVAKSQARGLRLVMADNFGGVMADVLVKPDGNVFVMRAKPPFRAAWIKRYAAADLNCIFDGAKETNCPLRILNPSHFVVERRWYTLDLQTVDIKPGAQPPEMFDETAGGKL